MAFRNQFVRKFPNPIEVDSAFATLAREHGQLCTLEELPYLSHGYYGKRRQAHGRHPMKVLRISSSEGPKEKPAVLLMRSPHAREWINAIAVVETARQLIENYRPDDTDPSVRRVVSILDNAEVMIIPEGNPDGARLSFFDDGYRTWRKNLRPSNTDCFGVDCNRNYSNYWGQKGSSKNPCSPLYCGPQALSEPETANVAKFTKENLNIVFAIDAHSHGQDIFRPNKDGSRFISDLPVSDADELIYEHLEGAMNRGIHSIQGNSYSTKEPNNHAGTSDEFFFFERQIFGFALESGRCFQPSFLEANLAALEVAEAVKALAWCATGNTGVDITALLRRRQTMGLNYVAYATEPIESDPLRQISTPPSERCPHLLLECSALRSTEMVGEFLELLERGCDIIGQTEDRLQIVASDDDVAMLSQLGYRPQVVRDLALGEAWRE